MDEVGGQYFAQARRYDAGVGRFVSEDFIKGHIAVPYTMNHYNYCWNRPMDHIKIFLPMQMKRSVHRRGEIRNGEQEHYYFHNNNNWPHFNI